MLSEKGCIEFKFGVDENIVKQHTRKLFIFSVIALTVGAAVLAAYIVLCVILEEAWVDALLVGAVPFAVGLIFVITVRKEIATARSLRGGEYAYEIFSDGAMFFSYVNGEKKGFVKIRWDGCAKAKETERYINFRYVWQVYYVDKSALTAAELNTLRKLLRLPYDGDAEVLTLAANY